VGTQACPAGHSTWKQGLWQPTVPLQTHSGRCVAPGTLPAGAHWITSFTTMVFSAQSPQGSKKQKQPTSPEGLSGSRSCRDPVGQGNSPPAQGSRQKQ
jgi:hypothetical protein